MFGERHSSELTGKGSGENGHKGPFTRSKFSIKNLVKVFDGIFAQRKVFSLHDQNLVKD
jgi:hypothetical protein